MYGILFGDDPIQTLGGNGTFWQTERIYFNRKGQNIYENCSEHYLTVIPTDYHNGKYSPTLVPYSCYIHHMTRLKQFYAQYRNAILRLGI